MIEFLRGWIINIVIISIFIAILEAILPNNSFKSYIKMVGGFLIIIALINPFINLISKNINIDKDVFSNIDKNNSLYYSNEKINHSNNNQIEELYIENLSSAIDESVEKKFNYNVKNIDIKLLESDEFKGEIKNLTIHLSKEKKLEENRERNIIIKKIDIGNKANNNNESQKNIKDEDLKKYIKDEFNIDTKKVNITSE